MSDDFSGLKLTPDSASPYPSGAPITLTLSGVDVETEVVTSSDSVTLSGSSSDGTAFTVVGTLTTSRSVVTQDSVKLTPGTYTSKNGIVFTVPAGGGLTATAKAP